MKKALIACSFFILGCMAFALSSYTDTAAFTLDTVAPTLTLSSPNGGETWYIGDTHNISWAASDTNLSPSSVFLWYSLNGGTLYTPLSEGILNDGTEPWTMPSVQSYNGKVKIRISDSFGNLSQKVSAAPFSITYVPPAAPEGVSINTTNGLDAVINWLPVTHTIYDSDITPDGYIILYNETPYEDAQFYYFLGRSYTTSFTHLDVAEFRTQMFYRVIAYKNYRGDDYRPLDQYANSKRVLWKDALNALRGGGK